MKQNALFACAFAILTVPVAAFAQPTVLISDGVTTIGPIHGSNGTITYTNTNFGDNWSVVIASGTTKPRFGSAASPNMELDVTATSKAPGDSLVIYFSDNSFGPAPGNFTAELDSHLVSGSDGTMSYDTYYDAGNALLATTTPLTASGPLTADNSGATWSGGTVTASPFSLTQVLTLGAGGEGGASYSINANLQAGCSTNGQIGDFVWNDLNRNGCQDEGEPGIQGVQVELYAGCGVTGTPVASTFTDVNGYYLFSGLCPGTYTVGFNTPAGFTRTVANVGCVNTSLPPYENQLDSKCNCSAATRCGVCVTLTTANPVNLNVDCGYTCSSEVVVIPPYAKQDIITVSLIRYGQYSVSISNAPNMGNWSDGPTVYKTATYRLTTADIIRAIAIVLHGNAGYYPASAQLVLVQGEIGGFFGYPYVSTLDDTSTTDGDNIRLASGRNMTNNPAGALPPGHNQPWGQIFVKVYDSKGNVTLCDNVTFFFGIRVEECYDCFYLNSFVTDATFKFLQRTGPPCCAGSSVTSAAGRDRYYMTLQFDNTLNNPYLNPDGVIYPAGTTNGVELTEHAEFYDEVGGPNGLYPPIGSFHVVGLRERDNGVDPDGLPYVDSIKVNVQNPLDSHAYDIYTMRFALKGIVTYNWTLKFINKGDSFPDFVGAAIYPVTGYGYVSKVCSLFNGTVGFTEAIVPAAKCCLDFPWRSFCGGPTGGYWFGIGDYDLQADLATGDTGYIENYFDTAVPGLHLGDDVPVNTDLDISFHANFDYNYEPLQQAIDNFYPQPGLEGSWLSDPANPLVQDVQPPQGDARAADGGTMTP